MMIIFNQTLRRRKMSSIKTTREIYSNIPKQEPKEPSITPLNPDLMSKVMDNLNKQPQIAPNITKK